MQLGIFTVDDERDGRIGRIEGETIVDVTDSVDTFATALQRMTDGEPIAVPDAATTYSITDVQLRPPTTVENEAFAIALNYASHIEEKSGTETVERQQRAVPETPYFFHKLSRSLIGHEAPINYYSDVTQGLDYAAELAAVIGTPARRVAREEALEYVAGYTILNDTAAYDVQNVSMGSTSWIDWYSAKSMDDTTPVGPWVVAADEVGDPHDLSIRSTVNGELMQDGSTAAMIRGVDEQVAFLSTRTTLRPGDLIATGTPAGVGTFQDLSLSDGDRIEIEIENVGRLENTVLDVDA